MQESKIPTEQLSNSVNQTVASVEQRSNKPNFLTIILSALLFISLAISGFFAFQNQKLVKELALLKNGSTPVATVEPEVTNSTPPDLTANWKTYTNNPSKYQIKYPAGWYVKNQSIDILGMIVEDASYIEIGMGEGKSGTIGIEEQQIIPPSEEVNLTATKVIGNLTLRCNGNFTTDSRDWCWIKVPNYDKFLNIQYFKNSNTEMNIVLDQILSTFKFIN